MRDENTRHVQVFITPAVRCLSLDDDDDTEADPQGRPVRRYPRCSRTDRPVNCRRSVFPEFMAETIRRPHFMEPRPLFREAIGTDHRTWDADQVERATLRTPNEVSLMVRRGEFPRPFGVGRDRRWKASEVEAWLELSRAAFAPAADTPSAADPSEYLSSRDIFRSIGFHGNRLRILVSHGEFPAPIRSGGRLRWRVSEVEAWLADRQARADEDRGRPGRVRCGGGSGLTPGYGAAIHPSARRRSGRSLKRDLHDFHALGPVSFR